jgi:hypothetical protein
MHQQPTQGELWVVNTDSQVLAQHLCPNRMQIGIESTRGLGCGGNPEIGRLAAEESADGLAKVRHGGGGGGGGGARRRWPSPAPPPGTKLGGPEPACCPQTYVPCRPDRRVAPMPHTPRACSSWPAATWCLSRQAWAAAPAQVLRLWSRASAASSVSWRGCPVRAARCSHRLWCAAQVAPCTRQCCASLAQAVPLTTLLHAACTHVARAHARRQPHCGRRHVPIQL